MYCPPERTASVPTPSLDPETMKFFQDTGRQSQEFPHLSFGDELGNSFHFFPPTQPEPSLQVEQWDVNDFALHFEELVEQHGRGKPQPATPLEENSNSVDDDDSQDELQEKIQQKINQRQTQIGAFTDRRGRVTYYNYDVSDLEYGPTPDTFTLHLKEILKKQSKAFKINVSLGLILMNKETGELRYFSPGPNLLSHDRPVLIHDSSTFEAFVEDMRSRDLSQWATLSRPSTKYQVVKITNILYEVTRLSRLIGGNTDLSSEVFKPFSLDRTFTAFLKDLSIKESKRVFFKDNLCFFRCLAKAFGHNHKKSNFEKEVYRLFQEYMRRKSVPLFTQLQSTFKGVCLTDLPGLEEIFHISIFVYDVSDVDNPENIVKSETTYPKKMHLALFHSHFMLINNFQNFAGKYVCEQCQGVYDRIDNFKRHLRNCPGRVTACRLTFEGQAYRPKPTIFEELEDMYDIVVRHNDRFHPYYMVFDFESVLGTPNPTEKRDNTDKLSYDRVHRPISVAIASNIQPYTDYKFIQDNDPAQLIDKFVEYLLEVSEASEELLRIRYGWVIQELEQVLIESEMYDGSVPVKDILKMMARFDNWLSATPVVGFNSAAYDLKLCRKYLIQILHEMEGEEPLVIKKGGSYTAIKTKHLKFVDVINYLAPGFSYDQFLKAFKASQTKAFFPYEFLDDPAKLKMDHLPSHEEFYSSLKDTNITETEYRYCQQIWSENNMTSMLDFLEFYNARDCVPFVEALGNMIKFYNEKGLDPFINAVSLPGIVEQYTYKTLPPDIYFRSMQTEDIYNLFRNNICGGPSIVFHRHHTAGKTKLREIEYGEDAKTCQKIVGFDANSLYLWAIAQELPTGPYVIRNSETNFKPEYIYNDGIATAYLEYISEKRGVYIQHALNGGERVVDYWKLDGYVPSTKGVIEVNGCYFHGCRKCTNHSSLHPTMKGKTFGDLYSATVKRNSYLRARFTVVEEFWECDIMKDSHFQEFLKRHRYNERKFQTLTTDQILARVLNGSLFGCVECDIHVPSHLTHKFHEFCPIFKTVDIPFRLVGEHMKTYARQMGISEKSTKSLVSSNIGERQFIATPLLRWYLQHGLEVSKVYKVVQFTPRKAFGDFAKEVSAARLAGARDPDKEILANTFKLWGNSAYGRTVMRKDKHNSIKYSDESKVENYILNPLFKRVELLQDDFYEVEMIKSLSKFELPIQIGFFVYQYAKLKMLAFYHDFIDKYVDRKDYQLMYMDTDSGYFAFSGDCIDDIVKPEMRDEYLKIKHEWLPRDGCPERSLIDKYTPGLFKVEFVGTEMICLNSKTYFCSNDESGAAKYSCKGVSKRLNKVKKELYAEVLRTQKSKSGTNKGFRLVDGNMWTYTQKRSAFTYYYIKREVLEDGVSTRPLCI